MTFSVSKLLATSRSVEDRLRGFDRDSLNAADARTRLSIDVDINPDAAGVTVEAFVVNLGTENATLGGAWLRITKAAGLGEETVRLVRAEDKVSLGPNVRRRLGGRRFAASMSSWKLIVVVHLVNGTHFERIVQAELVDSGQSKR